MKKERIALGWYITFILIGLLGFFSTLLVCLEVGGNHYIEYAVAFILSISIFSFGAMYAFLEIYNDCIEKNKEIK